MLKAANHKLQLKELMLKVEEMASLEEQRQATALMLKATTPRLKETGHMLKAIQQWCLE